MPTFNIRHVTKYTYRDPAFNSANEILLYPLNDKFQEVVSQQVMITGNPDVYVHSDYFGNTVGSFSFFDPHHLLVIDSEVEVKTSPRPAPNDSQPAGDQWQQLYSISNQVPYIDFLRQENFLALPDVMILIDSLKKDNATPLQAAKNLSEYIFNNFSYIKGVTTVESTLDDIWKLKSGVCQDFAHMLLVMLRQLFIPARYVSGYVCPNQNGMRGEGATHAWVEAWIPGNEWVGIDPTNNCLVNDLHVRLATGRSFTDCSPVRGTYRGGSDHTLEVAVQVEYEGAPRTDKEMDMQRIATETSTVDTNSFQRFQQIQQQQ